MTSARDPVGISSQGAAVHFKEDAEPDSIYKQVNEALALVKADMQRLAGLTAKGNTVTVSSGTYRLVATAKGILRAYVISDTATAGSTGAAYHTFSLRRNGVAANTQTFDTRRGELPAYLAGSERSGYLGEVPVAVGDVISVFLVVTGAPAPTLTTANLCISCTIRSN